MKQFRIIWAALAALALVLQPLDSFGRGSGSSSSGGSSSGSSKSSGFSSSGSSRSSSSGSSKPSSPSGGSSSKSSGWGTSSSASKPSSPKSFTGQSSTDKALGSKVNQSGGSSNRGEADRSGSFSFGDSPSKSSSSPSGGSKSWSGNSSGNESKSWSFSSSTPKPFTARYESKPASHPAEIPAMIVLDSSRSYPVGYYPQMGGYGYYDDKSSWHFYDPDDDHKTSVTFWKFMKMLLIIALCIGTVFVAAVIIARHRAARQQRLEDERREAERSQRELEAAQKAKEEKEKDPLCEWFDIAPRSILSLSDKQSLLDSKERTGVMGAIDFHVDRIDFFTDDRKLARYLMLHLNDGHQPLMLVVKEVDGDLDTRIYFQAPEFAPATRRQLIEEDRKFIFAPPNKPTGFKISDLSYTADLNYNDGKADTLYVRKAQGELHGTMKSRPAMSGLGARPTTLVEYRVAEGHAEPENPELLILETGKSANSGEISLYLGCPIQRSEIEILNAPGE